MLALESRSVTGTGETQNVPRATSALEVVLDVTAAATEAGDTLDVFIQAFVGGQWVDVVHFTQLLGNGGAKRYFAKITAAAAEAMFENAAALAAGSVRNLLSDSYRARWAIVDVATTGNQLFTFSVKANYVRTD